MTEAHKEKLRKLAWEVDPVKPAEVGPRILGFMQQAKLTNVVEPSKAVQVVAEEILKHPGGPLSAAERRVGALRKLLQVIRSHAHELDVASRITQPGGKAKVTNFILPQDLKTADKAVMDGSREVTFEQLEALKGTMATRIKDVQEAISRAETHLQRWTERVAPARVEFQRTLRELVASIMASLPANMRK